MAPIDFEPLHSAQTLDALLSAALAAGLGFLLDTPLPAWDVGPSMPGPVRLVVDELVEEGSLRTLRDLTGSETFRSRLWMQWGPGIERILVSTLADWLIGKALALSMSAGTASGDEAALSPSISAWELNRWASTHQVSHWLSASLSVLGEGWSSNARAWLWQAGRQVHSLQELFPEPHPRIPSRSRLAVPREVQVRALRFLEEQSLVAREGIEEERQRQASQVPPDDPVIRGVWETFRGYRVALRAQVVPRPAARCGVHRLTVHEDPPALVYVEDSVSWCGDGTPRQTIRLPLHAVPGQPGATCGCRSGAKGVCPMVIRALDVGMDALCAPEQRDLQTRIAHLITTPPWGRTLAHMDEVLQKAGVSTPAVDEGGRELGWLVQPTTIDALRVIPVLCKPRSKGDGWRTWKIDLGQVRQQPALCALPADREVVSLLGDSSTVAWRLGESAHRALTHRVLSLLVGHPRVLFAMGTTVRVQVQRGEVAMSWVPNPEGSIEVGLQLDGQPFRTDTFLESTRTSFAAGLWVRFHPEQRSITVTPVEAAVVELMRALQQRSPVFPPEAIPDLLGRLPAISRLIHVALPESLRGRQVPVDYRYLLLLDALPNAQLGVQCLVRPVTDGDPYIPGRGPEEIYLLRSEGRVFVVRDFDEELEQVRAALGLLGLPDLESTPSFQWNLTDPDTALSVLERLQSTDLFTVEWSDNRRRVLSRPAIAGDLRVSLETHRDWFGLSGDLQVDDIQVPLSALLDALLQGRRYVPVDDHTWIKLAEPFQAQMERILDVAVPGRGGFDLSPLHAQVVAELEAAGAHVEGTPTWSQVVERIHATAAMEPALHPAFQAELRSYQVDGFSWLCRVASWSPGACLADDMGLGKTVQALAFLAWRMERGPSLVVAPTSVGFNWVREAQRFAPMLRAIVYRGPRRRESLRNLGPGDLVITSYELLVRDQDAFRPLRFDTLILDEAQAIKNPTTRRARAVCLLNATFHLALTGTPVENRVGELWSLFRAIAPAVLGSWERFRTRFAIPMERDNDRKRRNALSRLIRPFVMRRLKSEVATELPPRTEVQIAVHLTPREVQLYNQVRMAALRSFTGVAAAQDASQQRLKVLNALTRLRQLACHARLLDRHSTLPSSKLEVLRGLVSELRAGGHRALIFSQFTRFLALVREALENDGVTCRYLDGQTPEHLRHAEVDAFQGGQGDVFLISLRAGGLGLNLTAATYVIHLDPWWNPAVEDQATDRAHRIGQEQPVTVYRLVSQGTIEEAILDLHQEKREMVAGLLDGTGLAATLGVEDLLALLRQEMTTEFAEEPLNEEGSPDWTQLSFEPEPEVVDVEEPAPPTARKSVKQPNKAMGVEILRPTALPVPDPQPRFYLAEPGIRPKESFPKIHLETVSGPDLGDSLLSAVPPEEPSRPVEDPILQLRSVPEMAPMELEHGGLEGMLFRYTSHLAAEQEAGRIGRPAMRAYCAAVSRLVRYTNDSGTPPTDLDSLNACFQRYIDSLKAGLPVGPASDKTLMPTAYRRFYAFAEDVGMTRW